MNIKKDNIATDFFIVNDENGNRIDSILPEDFTKYLYDPDGNEVANISGGIPVVISELGQGLYRLNFIPNKKGNWTLLIINSTYFAYGKVANYECVEYLIDDLAQYHRGRWKIVNNQLILYKDDNTTEIMRFNLFDAEGNPAVDNVFERRKV